MTGSDGKRRVRGETAGTWMSKAGEGRGGKRNEPGGRDGLRGLEKDGGNGESRSGRKGTGSHEAGGRERGVTKREEGDRESRSGTDKLAAGKQESTSRAGKETERR